METSPDADMIARAFMEEELAKDQPKSPEVLTVASEAVVATSAKKNRARKAPEPTQADVDAYIEGLDRGRKPVSPFGFDAEAADSISDEMKANNRAAKRAGMAAEKAGEKPLTFVPEIVDLDDVDAGPGLSSLAVPVAEVLKPEAKEKREPRKQAPKVADPKATLGTGISGVAAPSGPGVSNAGLNTAAPLTEVVPASGAMPAPEQRVELGLAVGEVWSIQEDGHDIDVEILSFFDGPDKKGNARMAKIRTTIAGPVINEDKTTDVVLHRLATRLKSYTKKREAPKEEKHIEPSLEPLAAEAVPAEPPASEVVGTSTPEGGVDTADLDAKIAELRNEVAEKRSLFISVEESQRSAWKNLTRIFRGLSHKDSDDGDIEKYRAWYDEKVLEWQNAELEKLKRSGKTVKELRPEMAALIREFEFNEADQIYDTRQRMRLQELNRPFFEKIQTAWGDFMETQKEDSPKNTNRDELKALLGLMGAVGSTTVRGIEKVGAGYNKLAKGKAGKYLLGATVAGAGAVAFGAATGGVASVAIGALALKRLAAGAGIAVAAEAGMNKYADFRREKKRASVEADHEARFDAMENEEDMEIKLKNKTEIDFSKLENYLKKVAAETRRGEGARRRGDLYRKSAAIFAGTVLGSGAAAHFANEYIGGASKAHAAILPESPQDSAAAAVPEGGAGSGGPVPVLEQPAQASKEAEWVKAARAIPVVPAEGRVAESLKDIRSVPSPVEIPEGSVKGLLDSHEVKRGESIWKLAEKAAGAAGMDDRASERFAKLVELRLAEKLEANSDLARSAGFVADADGKFSPHQIQRGATLELGKLLSQDEIAKLVLEAKSDAPIGAPSVAVPDTPIRETVTPVSTPALSEAELAAREEARIAERIPPISADERSATMATFPESPTTELIKPDGNVVKYIESLPREDQEKLFRNFKKLSVELFQTNDVMGGEVYDMQYDPVVHPELTKTKLAAVIADHKLLAKNPLVGYDRLKNPLHWSQMEEVVKFAKASAKAFGESVAQPKGTESVQEYVLRMIAIAHNQDVKIPGFRMLD